MCGMAVQGFNISSWVGSGVAVEFCKDVIEMGSSHIRYQLSVFSDEVLHNEVKYEAWLDEQLSKIDFITAALKTEGYQAKFIIDMHSPIGGLNHSRNKPVHTLFVNQWYRERWKRLLVKIVNSTKHNPMVWAYEPLNEPAIPNVKRYERVMRSAVRLIRRHSNKRILYPCPGVGPREMRLVEPLNEKNIVYTCHMYSPMKVTLSGLLLPKIDNPLEDITKFKIKQALRPAVNFKKKYRKNVVIGEIGCSTYVGSVAQREYFKLVLDECKRQRLGWMIYPYDPTASIWNYEGNGSLDVIRRYF